ncbi:MAG: hypothetical protein ABSG95_12135 [Solirubrobacteraceae bacterium]
MRGERPEELMYLGSAGTLNQAWIAVRANLRLVLERTTVADVAAGRLPRDVLAITRRKGAWKAR